MNIHISFITVLIFRDLTSLFRIAVIRGNNAIVTPLSIYRDCPRIGQWVNELLVQKRVLHYTFVNISTFLTQVSINMAFHVSAAYAADKILVRRHRRHMSNGTSRCCRIDRV